jgi:hypothetical protein
LDMVRSSGSAGGEVEGRPEATQLILGCQEKPSSLWQASVLKPTLVGKGKYPKVDETTLVKELGKLTP